MIEIEELMRRLGLKSWTVFAEEVLRHKIETVPRVGGEVMLTELMNRGTGRTTRTQLRALRDVSAGHTVVLQRGDCIQSAEFVEHTRLLARAVGLDPTKIVKYPLSVPSDDSVRSHSDHFVRTEWASRSKREIGE